MRTMYDSVTAANIPADAEIVAGYINGRYKWSPADWARFPNALHVRIAIYIPGQIPPNDGDVLDVEARDASTPRALDLAKRWCNSRLAAGVHPTIYTSKATHYPLNMMGADMWLADYTHQRHLLPEACATQYDNPGPYDISVCADWWPRRKEPAPVPTHEPIKVTTVDELVIPPELGGGAWLLQPDGAVFAFPVGAINFGGANGKPYFDGRIARELVARNVAGSGEYSLQNPPYAIIATSGERYGDGGF